jgi:2-dehydropantoate 2-reductase
MCITTNKQKPTWYILGAGAIGCLWASYWRQAGFSVVLITPSARQQNFIELHADNKNISTPVRQITIEQLKASTISIDYLLVSTKAQHTLAAVAAIENQLTKNATVLVLQNGMAVKKLSPLLPSQQVIAATTTDGAYRSAPMSVVHAGKGETWFGGDESLLAMLPTDYLTIKYCNDIDTRLWQKLAINCAINGLTAIYRCRNGELLNNPEAVSRMQNLCNEVIAVATAMGLSAAVNQLSVKVVETLRTTANNYSSMYQDIAHKRSTEINFINGYICELANKNGITCDENQYIVDTIKQLEAAVI